MNQSTFNSEIFDEVLRIVVRDYHQKEIAEYNNITEEDKHIFSPEFEKKMKILFKRGKKFKNDVKKYTAGFLQKSAIIVLIILSVSFISLFAVEAVREEIYKIITTFYEKYIQVGFGDTNVQNLIADIPPEQIEETYLPSYVPDGYWEEKVSKSDNNVSAVYINNENQNIFYYQRLISAFTFIDGEDYIENDINISGMSGKIYEYNKHDEISYFIIIWRNNKYSYQVIGYVDREEMIKIAESVIVQDIEK